MSAIGLWIGVKCGRGVAKKLRAELWGGIILIAIGVKVLIEHTMG
jgi:putative Mn2+ efflux pump MntP